MIRIEKNLGNVGSEIDQSRELPRLVMSYDQRKKGRIRVETDSGNDVGLFLERGKVLIHGDILESTEGEYFQVSAKPEKLLEGKCEDWLTFSRCCYHLGNRHVPIEILEKKLRLQSDHILAEMLELLGMEVTELEAPFNPEQGAYSLSGIPHHHEH